MSDMEASKLEQANAPATSPEPSQEILNSIPGAHPFGRRDFLALATAGAASALPLAATTAESSPFPKGFLWGAATAAHQVEGNNINSDLWVLEHLKPTIFAEPSGDACDHYHRYADDIKLLAQLGFNTYRFSIEWARIEPEQGFFSKAELDHYRRMLAACHENNLQPMVTFSHFSVPRWFAGLGGWENDGSVDLFSRYAEHSAKHLGDLISFATTFNEPNVPMLLRWMNVDLSAGGPMVGHAARAIGSDRFGSFFMGNSEKLRDHMVAAHQHGLAALKSGPGKYPVGVNLAIADDQAVGADSGRDRKREEIYGSWLRAASASDFVGVQTYTRARVGKDKDLPPEPGVELTQAGWEFWPEALGETIRYAAAQAKVPVYVTENGIATEDDSRRIEYIKRALAGVRKCLAGGIDVRGYIYWSLMDNFEWMSGFRPKFGLMAVNRDTQERLPRPSARFLGDIARRNGA
jgi:beta-glucosidase